MIEFLCEQLSPLGTVSYKRMFGLEWVNDWLFNGVVINKGKNNG